MKWRTVLQIVIVLALAVGIAGYVAYNEYHNAQYTEFMARALEECRRGHPGGARRNLEEARKHITSADREEAWKETSIKITRNQCD